MSEEPPEKHDEVFFGSERAKAFVDAVVAIAMTLLILPLMEAVTDFSSKSDDRGFDAATWLDDHRWQLISFVLSFAIIAMFWVSHHALFAKVDRITSGLLWLNLGWLLTIVWVPVATALIGRGETAEPAAAIAYLGAMMLTDVLFLAMHLYLRAHPGIHDIDDRTLRNGLATALTMIVLFAVALALILCFPAVGYWWMFVMMLTGPTQSLAARALGVRR